MHTLLIVGHPYSGYQFVEETLKTCGMREANNSKAQSLSPQEVHARLLKTRNIKSQNLTNIRQIKASKIWDGLALDLLLGNIDQEFWGWSDPQSIYLLEYWKSIEPNLKFILVYSSPEEHLTAVFKNKKASKKEFQKAVMQWENYNEELTKFHLNNTKSCLLVNLEQLKKAPPKFIESVSAFIGLPLKSDGGNNKKIITNGIDLILARNFIQPLTRVQELYEEMQSIADIPFPIQTDDSDDLISSWNTAHDTENQKIEIPKDNHNKILNLEKENELLVLQIHQVQEELEHYYLEYQKLITKNSQKKLHYGAGERIKQRLAYRLGAAMIEKSRSFSGCLDMPWELLRISKQFNREKSQRDAAKLPKLSEYQDAYEVEVIKHHLSYRLGASLLSNIKSPIGWIKLPFALRHDIKDFQRQREGK